MDHRLRFDDRNATGSKSGDAGTVATLPPSVRPVQKEGKKRMKTIGRVEVPQEAFVAALSTDSSADKTKK